MTTFKNQAIGSHDVKGADDYNRFDYVEVWFDEALVKGFKFHSIISRDIFGNSFMIYDVTVDARHIWQAIMAFSQASVMAVRPDGSEFFVTWVSVNDKVEELRMGSKYGKAVARKTNTGYVQNAA